MSAKVDTPATITPMLSDRDKAKHVPHWSVSASLAATALVATVVCLGVENPAITLIGAVLNSAWMALFGYGTSWLLVRVYGR